MTYPGSDYQGFGFYEPPQPKRDRRRLIVVIAAVALVVALGAVVTVVLLNQETSGTPVVQSDPVAPSSTTTTSRPKVEDGQTMANPDAKLTYDVPKSWALSNSTASFALTSLPEVKIDHLAIRAPYQCGGKDYTRGVVGSGTVSGGEINQRVTDLAKAFGKELYDGGTGTDVVVGTPQAITRKGDKGEEAKGVAVRATVTTKGEQCLATKGDLWIVLLDYAGGMRMLVVNGDLVGGPDTPAPVPADELAAIAESARPTG
ncbi:hypothetical protein V5P93_005555 [Actinokineospora auranticolor]|uniref:hypothetical protein n=1 Tax=Actinokineospora auranticolor TaxID=155976 RepID=UPI0011B095A9|nr:hypothetical protein [Actinokineospora auranticolor]